jgi:hypothetical protein
MGKNPAIFSRQSTGRISKKLDEESDSIASVQRRN